MAWNKPAANPQPKQKKPSAKPSLKHGIIAGNGTHKDIMDRRVQNRANHTCKARTCLDDSH